MTLKRCTARQGTRTDRTLLTGAVLRVTFVASALVALGLTAAAPASASPMWNETTARAGQVVCHGEALHRRRAVHGMPSSADVYRSRHRNSHIPGSCGRPGRERGPHARDEDMDNHMNAIACRHAETASSCCNNYQSEKGE